MITKSKPPIRSHDEHTTLLRLVLKEVRAMRRDFQKAHVQRFLKEKNRSAVSVAEAVV